MEKLHSLKNYFWSLAIITVGLLKITGLSFMTIEQETADLYGAIVVLVMILIGWLHYKTYQTRVPNYKVFLILLGYIAIGILCSVHVLTGNEP